MKRAYERCRPGLRRPIAVFDFETDGLGGKPLACSYKIEGMEKAVFLHKGDFIQELFYIMCEYHDHDWYAHNAQYDLRYLIDCLESRSDDLSFYMRTDTDIFLVKLSLPEYNEKAVLTIRDSFALFPQSLRKFGEVFAPELPKGSIDIANFDPRNPEHQQYALRDSDLLLLCLSRFFDLLYDKFGIWPAATTASTALRAWQFSLSCSEKYHRVSETYDTYIRSAYFGGLVFLTDTNSHNAARTYDINSSYPYQMETYEFPVGNPVNTTKFHPKKLSIYHVNLTTPPDLIVPIIPSRDAKGILWQSGTFDTFTTNVELEFAISQGYVINKIHSGLVWEKTASPFKEFVDRCKSIRQKYKGTALETVAKLMQNSLYGKFATKKIRRQILAHWSEQDIQEGGEFWGDRYLIKQVCDDEMLTMPQWAVFVTARARLHLLKTIYALGPSNVIYGDTDSITIKQSASLPAAQIGNSYGQFKLEKSWQIFRARAPKVYAGILDGGKQAGAIKGIPKREWQNSGALSLVLSGNNALISYETLPAFLQFLKGDREPSRFAHRAISEIARARSWQLAPDGTVRPRRAA